MSTEISLTRILKEGRLTVEQLELFDIGQPDLLWPNERASLTSLRDFATFLGLWALEDKLSRVVEYEGCSETRLACLVEDSYHVALGISDALWRIGHIDTASQFSNVVKQLRAIALDVVGARLRP